MGETAGTSGSRRAASAVASGRAPERELYSTRDISETADRRAEQFAHIPAHLMEAYGPGTHAVSNLN
jgi:hypothetical protein